MRHARRSRPRKALTIGAVAKILSQEFDDISISKIRYLEDQKLLAPRRTAGRLPPLQPGRRRAPAGDPAHAARRVPAAAGDPPGAGDRATSTERRRAGDASQKRRARSRSTRAVPTIERSRSCSSEAGVGEEFLRELQEFGIVQPERRDGRDDLRRDRPRDRPRRRRARPGSASAGRNLRVFRTSADREAALLEQLLGAAAALAQPGAPQGGGREPREPRRGLRPPQAPAAGPRPAAAQVGRLSPRRRADAPGLADRGRSPAPPERVWDLVSDPHNLPRWWPRTMRVEDVAAPSGERSAVDDGARDRARGAACAPTTAASARAEASATPGSRRSRARRSSASCAARGARDRARARGDGGTEVTLTSERDAARPLAARLADDARRRTRGASTRRWTGSSGRWSASEPA